MPDTLDGLQVRTADALIIVPPWGDFTVPSLGVHTLQASSRQRGLSVSVFYASVVFARQFGAKLYSALAQSAPTLLLGERVFSAAAFGLPHLGTGQEGLQRFLTPSRDQQSSIYENEFDPCLTYDLLGQMSQYAHSFCDEVCRYVLSLRPRVVGCTSTFQQTAASVAILRRIKLADPKIVTVIGGANCDGVMAESIRALSPHLDYVFSGDSDVTFPDFLEGVMGGQELPLRRVIRGSPYDRLDDSPEPDFDEFFDQIALLSDLETEQVGVAYETSRGCWWGEKHHCTFCGVNGSGMRYRQKSADTVIRGFSRLKLRYPGRQIRVADNIMPHSYFNSVIPRLPAEVPSTSIFYEQKANITFSQMKALRWGGVTEIQPGIEALSSPLLSLMKKGVTARQNVALLRYARMLGVNTHWNILYDFPNDNEADYEQTLTLIPFLYHLQPPVSCSLLTIERFSPYFSDPSIYKIGSLTPLESYGSAFPQGADLDGLAYFFRGEYDSVYRRRPDVARELLASIGKWRELWNTDGRVPFLLVTPWKEDQYMLTDTRWKHAAPKVDFVDHHKARAALMGGPQPGQKRFSSPHASVTTRACCAGLLVRLCQNSGHRDIHARIRSRITGQDKSPFRF